ncbi:hypothetical protein Patl1_34805 [Pistacia atlantica]|uniref:Uncharacterized protein n=1 Tax=Pistacia atlantica TaxID=434234 RepID=A0ACC0ZT61_9ROSI|nr:hypothetical protein Patl1_34805 [Pistacia atlantica]
MGELLHNAENVIKASDIMVHEQGLHFSPRKVTVSATAPSPAPPVQTALFPPKTQVFCPVSQTAAAWTVHPLSRLAKEFIPCHVVQGNFGQSQTTAPIQPASRLISPADTFGPVIPIDLLAQASNAPVQPSSNRSTN